MSKPALYERAAEVVSLARLEVGRPEHFLWLRGIIVTIFFLNWLDASFTIWWVVGNYATEANPLMSYFMGYGLVSFAVNKTLIVCVGCVILWHLRERHVAVVGIFMIFLAYYWVLLYHLHMASRLLAQW